MNALPSGTVTFLFSDIEGSTALLKQLGRDGYERVLREHGEILRGAVATHDGRVVDTQGDSFFVAFRAARDAVAAAVAAQRELGGYDWPDGVQLKVRMGLHSGEPKAGEERYVGIGVHRAARIGAAAHGGQALLSDATRALVEDDLPAGISMRDLGSYELKDIDRPERLSQVVSEGLRQEFPPLRGAKLVRSRPVLRRRSLLASMLAAVIAAAVAIPVFAFGQGSGGSVASAASLIRIDPANARVVAGVQVSGRAAAVATCAGSVVVTGPNGVFEIDPQAAKPYLIPVRGTPGDVANVGGLAMVISGPPKNTMTIIDTTFGRISNVVKLPGAPSVPAAVASYGLDVWIANPNAHELELVRSPYTGISRKVRLPTLAPNASRPTAYAGVAAGEGAVWIAGNDTNRTVWRIDQNTRKITTIRLAFAPRAIAAGYGGVWVVDRRGGAVVRIDPATNRLGQSIPVGRSPSAVAVGGGFVWVANEGSGTLSRIEPERVSVKTTPVGSKPVDLVVGLGAVWVVRRTT